MSWAGLEKQHNWIHSSAVTSGLHICVSCFNPMLGEEVYVEIVCHVMPKYAK